MRYGARRAIRCPKGRRRSAVSNEAPCAADSAPLDECRHHPSPGTDERPRSKAWDRSVGQISVRFSCWSRRRAAGGAAAAAARSTVSTGTGRCQRRLPVDSVMSPPSSWSTTSLCRRSRPLCTKSIKYSCSPRNPGPVHPRFLPLRRLGVLFTFTKHCYSAIRRPTPL